MVFRLTPVMRSIARMLVPSASMEITATFFSVSRMFAIAIYFLFAITVIPNIRCQSTIIFVIHAIIFMTKKDKVGRPKLPKDQSRAPGISVRLTQGDRKPIDAAIKRSGLTQSDWARKSLIYVA